MAIWLVGDVERCGARTRRTNLLPGSAVHVDVVHPPANGAIANVNKSAGVISEAQFEGYPFVRGQINFLTLHAGIGGRG